MTDAVRRSRKLYKCPDEAIIAGVAAGVARYFDVDTVLVRALWVASLLVGGFGFIAYVILWIVLDDEPTPRLPLDTHSGTHAADHWDPTHDPDYCIEC